MRTIRLYLSYLGFAGLGMLVTACIALPLSVNNSVFRIVLYAVELLMLTFLLFAIYLRHRLKSDESELPTFHGVPLNELMRNKVLDELFTPIVVNLIKSERVDCRRLIALLSLSGSQELDFQFVTPNAQIVSSGQLHVSEKQVRALASFGIRDARRKSGHMKITIIVAVHEIRIAITTLFR
jgi:hypothetical protein